MRLRPAIPVALLAALACSPSPSVEIDVPQWTVSTEPAIRIGDDEAGEESQFHQIRAVTRFLDGTIAVADGGSAEIRLFDRSGDYVRTIGRRGNGPGEFPYLHRLLRTGDTILAGHMSLMSRFTSDGTYLGSRRLDWTGLSSGTHHLETMHPLSFDAWAVMLFESGNADDTDRFFRPGMLWLAAGTALEWIDTIGTFGGIEQMNFNRGGAELTVFPTFPVSTERGFQDGLLVIGDSDTDSIVWYDGRDRSRGVIRVPWNRPEISSAELKRVRARSCDWASGERREQCLAGVAQLPGQTHLPFFATVHPDAAGMVWVAQSATSVAERHWIVFDRDSRPIAKVALPRGLEIREIGIDYILGVVRDEDGVEFVVEYELTRNRDGTT